MTPVMLMILDGWGMRDDRENNAAKLANTPHFDRLWAEFPHTTLSASGEDVGLPETVMGNSEVGHLNLGAGRIVYQDLTRINKSIRDGEFSHNPQLQKLFSDVKAASGRLHVMGLLSDGGVHSHIQHVFAILDSAVEAHIPEIYIHAFLDGRDTDPKSGVGYLRKLEEKIRPFSPVKIASISGRYYAMDRDKRWERVNKAYDAVANGIPAYDGNALQAVEASYAKGVSDEFMMPLCIDPNGKLRDGDGVLFFNYRADRARELTLAITDPSFKGFERGAFIALSTFVTMTQYDKLHAFPLLFPSQRHVNILSEVVSQAGLKQLRMAETEKYAHVTFFFNGGVEKSWPGEERVLIQSPRDVATYDLKPEMSAFEVTDGVLARIMNDAYDLIILNFANPDMVGHTGVLNAAIQAVETVDGCMGRIVDAMLAKNGAVIIIADHGNCEIMANSDGSPNTAHTTNPVPCILVCSSEKESSLRSGGRLADISPTILNLLNISQPKEMTGTSLLVRS